MGSLKNWEILLQFIYTADDEWKYFSKGDTGIDRTHPFVTETELDVKGAKSGYSFIQRLNLIEESHDGFVKLSKDGFEVIRDQEHNRNQTRANQAMVLFTIVLSLVTVIQIIAEQITPENLLGLVSLGGLLSLMLIGIYYLASPYLKSFI